MTPLQDHRERRYLRPTTPRNAKPWYSLPGHHDPDERHRVTTSPTPEALDSDAGTYDGTRVATPEPTGKAYYIDQAKALLLNEQTNPDADADGHPLGHRGKGIREGQILTYLDVILHTPGAPAYDVDADTLRKMLLGQALNDYYGG